MTKFGKIIPIKVSQAGVPKTEQQERFVERGSGFLLRIPVRSGCTQVTFFRKLREVVDWRYFTKCLIELYKGQGVVGPPPFDPALVTKVEFIAQLYKLSERKAEIFVNANLPTKYLIGLAVDGKAPDHSNLTTFRER